MQNAKDLISKGEDITQKKAVGRIHNQGRYPKKGYGFSPKPTKKKVASLPKPTKEKEDSESDAISVETSVKNLPLLLKDTFAKDRLVINDHNATKELEDSSLDIAKLNDYPPKNSTKSRIRVFLQMQ